MMAKASSLGAVLGKGQTAQADEGDQIGDKLIEKVLAREFTASMDELSPQERVKYEFTLKSRDDHLKELKNPDNEFDILIVGGGANGAGVVLDAASRGLKCAVIDSYDFAAGTSSKSTKMAHGGIRYF